MCDDYFYPGYKPGPPNEEVGLKDAEIAERIPCPRCGGKCHYWAQHTDGSYLAYAVCNDAACQGVQEF